MAANNSLERDAVFRRVRSIGTLTIPFVGDVETVGVQSNGSVVYDQKTGLLWLSNGLEWIAAGTSCQNVGSGTGVYVGDIGGTLSFRSLKSVSGTVNISVADDHSISLDVGSTSISSNLPPMNSGDMMYATSSSSLGTVHIGDDGSILVSNGSVPVWMAPEDAIPQIENVGEGVALYASGTIKTLSSDTLTITDLGVRGVRLNVSTPNLISGNAGVVVKTLEGVSTLPSTLGTKYLSSVDGNVVWSSLPLPSSFGDGVTLMNESFIKSLTSDGSIVITDLSNTIHLSTSISNIFGGDTTSGSLVYIDPDRNGSQLPIGEEGYVLTSNGTTPSWNAPVTTSIQNIGTGVGIYASTTDNVAQLKKLQSTPTVSVSSTPSEVSFSTSLTQLVDTTQTGSIVYVSSSRARQLPIGTSGKYLKSDGTNPVWSDPSFVNVGEGVGIANDNGTFKSLASSTLDISSIGDVVSLDITLSKLAGEGLEGQVLTCTGGTVEWFNLQATNLGNGVGVYSGLSNSLQFKSISGSSTVTVEESPENITLSANINNMIPNLNAGDIVIGQDVGFVGTLGIGTATHILSSDGVTPIWKQQRNTISKNTIVVTPNPTDGEYNCVYDAMNSIPTDDTRPTSNNPCVIFVYSGRYREPDTVIFKEYVYVIGEDIGGVFIEPLSEGYDLFRFTKATSLSFCSIQGSVTQYACIFDDTGYIGSEFALMHKVNIYSSKILVTSHTTNSLVYFEYVSYASAEDEEIDNTVVIVSSGEYYSYLSVENHFVEGIVTDSAIRVDGNESYFFGQLCNFVNVAPTGCGMKVVNGGQVDIRTSYFEGYNSALSVETSGVNPKMVVSGVTFKDNTYNINIKNSTTSGYLHGYSEYSKTIINPSVGDTFFIGGTNQRILTVGTRGADFTSIKSAIDAVNISMVCGMTNESTTLTSDGLFTALLNGVTVIGDGIPPNTFGLFVDESTMTLTNAALSTSVLNVSFKRATQLTPYTIQVQPGTYFENTPILVDSFVNILGMNRDTCVVLSITPSTNTFIIKDNASIKSLNVYNSNSDVYAVVIRDGLYSFVNDVVFYNSNKAISFEARYISYLAEVENCIFVGGSGDTGVCINNTDSSLTISISISNLRCMQRYSSFFRLGGLNTLAAIRNCALQSDGTGTVLTIYDSCRVNVQGLYVAGWEKCFSNGDSTLGYPYLAIVGLTQTNISGNILDITNQSTLGYYTGYVPYSQVSIHTSSSFFITNKDQKVIVVAKKGADFSSIAAAIDSIEDASPSNIYTISVGPGIFIEDPIVMKSYTSIRGAGYQATVIVCNQSSGSVVTGADSSLVSGCTFTGCTSVGGRAIYFEGTGTAPGSPFIVDNCVLGSNHTLVEVNASVNPAVMILTLCLYGARFDANEGVSITSVNGQLATLLVYNCVFQDLVVPVPQTLFDIDGENALLVASNTLVQLNGTNTSVAIRMRNGAGARIYGSSFVGLNNGIIAENIGDGPGLVMASSSFERCGRMITIENPATTGYFIGSVDISKVFIHPQSSFYIKDRVPTNLIVSKKGSDYTSIRNAIDYIHPTISISVVSGSVEVSTVGDLFDPSMDGCLISGSGIVNGSVFTYLSPLQGLLSSPAESSLLSNVTLSGDIVVATILRSSEVTPYVISVQPGVYQENELVLPKYTTLKGESTESCVVLCHDDSATIISLSQHSCLCNMSIRGNAGVGVRVDSVEGGCIENVTIRDCQQGVFVTGTTGECRVKCSNVDINGEGIYGVLVDGSLLTTTYGVNVSLTNLSVNLSSLNHTGMCFEGPNATVVTNSSIIGCDNTLGSTGISLDDGCTLIVSSTQILKSTLDGLIVLDNGAPPSLYCNGCSFLENTGKDIHIQHPATDGCVNMVSASNVVVDENADITVTYVNNVDKSVTLAGIIKVGRNESTTVDIVPYILGGLTIGVNDGGVIGYTSGNTITITAGNGYLRYGTTVKLVEWNDSSLLLGDGLGYVSINSLGNVVSLSSKGDLGYIFLGRVFVTNGNVDIIEQTAMSASHTANQYDLLHRKAIGAVASGGMVLTVDASLVVSITGGTYFFSGVEVTVTGYSGVFYAYSSAGYTQLSSINPGVYSSGEVPPLHYTKNTFYLVGGDYQRLMMVYSDSTYEDINDCLAGSDPIPPYYFNESIIRVGDVIVQQGTSFSRVIDRRPLLSTSVGGTSNTLVHSNLQGLLDDDHPQYLLVNGSRSMNGDLDLGGNNLVNIGDIGGVNVSSHSSRHLPNGSDPLNTSSPIGSLSCVSSNYVGVANSFARSDHLHTLDVGIPSSQRPDYPNTEGSSVSLARADHQHNIPTDIPVDIGVTNTLGSTLAFSRSDHIHQGVHSIIVDNAIYGDITLNSGKGVNIVQSSNTITIDTTIGSNEFVSSVQGLSVIITGGRGIVNGSITNIPSGTIDIPPNSSGVVYIDEGVITIGTSFGYGVVPVATYVSTGDTVTLSDARIVLNSFYLPYTSNTLVVDGVYGSDTFGRRDRYPYLTITKALEDAISGDRVVVRSGVYSISEIVVPSGIELIGENATLESNVTESAIVITNSGTVSHFTVNIVCLSDSIIIEGIKSIGGLIEDVYINISSAHPITNISSIRTSGNTIVRRVNTQTTYSEDIGIVRSLVNDLGGRVEVSDSTLNGCVETNNVLSVVVLRNCKVSSYLETLGSILLYDVVVGDTPTFTSIGVNAINTSNGIVSFTSYGECVTTSSTQLLTNKTLDDPSNSINANKLQSIEISSVSPIAGEVLIATSPSSAEWSNLSDIFTPGNGIAISSGTISNSGVTSVAATNGVSVDSAFGSVTITGSYSGGIGISITGDVISNTGITSVSDTTLTKTGTSIRGNYVGGNGITVTGNTISSSLLASNATIVTDGASIRGNYVGGTGISIVGNVVNGNVTSSSIGGSTLVSTPMSLKGIVAGAGVSVSSSLTDITISNSSTISAGDDTIVVSTDEIGNTTLSGGYVGGSGINISGNVITSTGSTNVTSAGGTYTLISTPSSIKGLSSGSGISLSTNSSTIVITNSSPASSISLYSTGGTTSLVGDATYPNLGVKGIVAGSGITITSSTTDITISSTGGSLMTASDTTIVVSGTTIRGNYIGGTGITVIGNTITSTITLSSAGGINSLVGPSGESISVKGITAGSGVSISSNESSLTITNSGVRSITAGAGVVIGGTINNPIVSANYSSGNGIDINGNTISLSSIPIVSFSNPVSFSVSNSSYSPSGYFAWSSNLYGTYTLGYLTFYVNIPSTKSVDARVYDRTNNVTLGSTTDITISGTYTFYFTNPTTDTYISFDFRRQSSGGSSPVVYGMQWGWSQT